VVFIGPISGGTINGINNGEVHFPNEVSFFFLIIWYLSIKFNNFFLNLPKKPSSSRHNNALKRKVEGDEEDTEDESEQNILNNDNASI
jgi:hypothetical protein